MVYSVVSGARVCAQLHPCCSTPRCDVPHACAMLVGAVVRAGSYFLDEYRFAPKGAVLAHEMTGVKADMDEDTCMKFTFAITTKSRV